MSRNLHLDNFRGLLLIIILIDHLHLHLSSLTNNTLGYISAAEGFIFLSGLVAGMVYIARAKKNNCEYVASLALRRSLTIYLFHISLYTLSLLIFLNSSPVYQYWERSSPLFATDPVNALFLGILLLYQPSLNDILPIYSIFLLVMPFVINRLLKNKLRFIVLTSISLYILAQFFVLEFVIDSLNKSLNLSIDLGYFNIFSWQLLFLLGLITGNLEVDKNPGWLAFKQNKVVFIIFLLFITFCFTLRHTLNKDVPYAAFLINRSHLSPLRLLNFLTMAFVLNYLICRYKPRIISRFLVFLGQNSLQVFAFHVILAFCLAPVVPMIMKKGILFELFFTTIVILSLGIPAYLNDLYKKGFNFKFGRIAR